MSRLARFGARGIGRREAPWEQLGRVVTDNCGKFEARNVANVVHGYARLTKCGLSKRLVPFPPLDEAVRRLAPAMVVKRGVHGFLDRSGAG